MRSFLAELRRRNVLRAGALYAAGVWALAQGIAQLGPAFGLPDWGTRWFVIAAIIGFPFWVAFAWFYEFTPEGLKRESEVDPGESIRGRTGKKLDRWVIAVLALAVVLLLTDRFVLHRDSNKLAMPALSIAVLPLTNESGNADEQYFSDGLSEDLITALSQFEGLKVIGRNSAFQFRDTKDDSATIGAKLGVAHLMEGSVRRVGETVRISAELITAADGSTLWSQHFDRPYKDLFALQDEITQSVASALQAKLLPNTGAVAQRDRPPSGNLDAYNAYLRGKYFAALFTEASSRRAIEQYSEAVRLDPSYALAHAALSSTWTIFAANFLDGESAEDAYAKARAEVNTALTLDADVAAAHVARGTLLTYVDFDWKGAQAEYREALRLAPNNGSALVGAGQMLAVLGHADQALAPTRSALTSDPLHASWYATLGSYLSALGGLDEAEAATRKSIELQPGASARYEQLTIIAVLRGDAKAAMHAATQEPPPEAWQQISLALAQQISGDRAAADAALDTLIRAQEHSAAFQIAEVYAVRRDPDRMFEWLEHAWSARDAGISSLLYDPLLMRYKDDPRFGEFCKKAGLPTPGTALQASTRVEEAVVQSADTHPTH